MMQPTSPIVSLSYVQQASAFLANIDADWAQLVTTLGPCTLGAQNEYGPYEALISAVAHQQLHTKAGDAILRKFLQHFALSQTYPTPHQLIEAKFEDLRVCGFSEKKVETLKAVAHGVLIGIVPSRIEADTMRDDVLIERLTTLKGIGQWTVEMLLIFTLARTDILPVNDLGIRQGYQRLKKLGAALTPKQMLEIGKDWSPYRTAASWYLWRVPKN